MILGVPYTNQPIRIYRANMIIPQISKAEVDDERTKEYFTFCQIQGIMPSFRRLSNWYGYSFKQLYTHINKETDTGLFLDRVRDAIKDNLEQAALINAVNNISAMFILKTQHDYVEATKVVLEPSETLLGKPKTVEEIEDYIDADIVEE